jgi:hypothetical protein
MYVGEHEYLDVCADNQQVMGNVPIPLVISRSILVFVPFVVMPMIIIVSPIVIPIILSMALPVTRHVHVTVPAILHKIDGASTRIVFAAVLAPILCVAGRYA